MKVVVVRNPILKLELTDAQVSVDYLKKTRITLKKKNKLSFITIEI